MPTLEEQLAEMRREQLELMETQARDRIAVEEQGERQQKVGEEQGKRFSIARKEQEERFRIVEQKQEQEIESLKIIMILKDRLSNTRDVLEKIRDKKALDSKILGNREKISEILDVAIDGFVYYTCVERTNIYKDTAKSKLRHIYALYFSVLSNNPNDEEMQRLLNSKIERLKDNQSYKDNVEVVIGEIKEIMKLEISSIPSSKKEEHSTTNDIASLEEQVSRIRLEAEDLKRTLQVNIDILPTEKRKKLDELRIDTKHFEFLKAFKGGLEPLFNFSKNIQAETQEVLLSDKGKIAKGIFVDIPRLFVAGATAEGLYEALNPYVGVFTGAVTNVFLREGSEKSKRKNV